MAARVDVIFPPPLRIGKDHQSRGHGRELASNDQSTSVMGGGKWVRTEGRKCKEAIRLRCVVTRIVRAETKQTKLNTQGVKLRFFFSFLVFGGKARYGNGFPKSVTASHIEGGSQEFPNARTASSSRLVHAEGFERKIRSTGMVCEGKK